MNTELFIQMQNERLETLRQEASILSQLKTLFAPRPMKKVKTLRQFEQRRVNA
jgi:hypothetical protein